MHLDILNTCMENKIRIIDANWNMKKDEDGYLVKLKSIRVTFEGIMIPDFINFYNCLLHSQNLSTKNSILFKMSYI